MCLGVDIVMSLLHLPGNLCRPTSRQGHILSAGHPRPQMQFDEALFESRKLRTYLRKTCVRTCVHSSRVRGRSQKHTHEVSGKPKPEVNMTFLGGPKPLLHTKLV